MTSEPRYRLEHDSMGDVRVPIDAKWRAQTQRAVENFPVSGLVIDRDLISALASIKGEAATVNAELGVIDPASRCRRSTTRRPKSRAASGIRSSPSTFSRPAPEHPAT